MKKIILITTFIMIVLSNISLADLIEGNVFYYSFDNSSITGTTIIDSANNFNGTMVNTPTTDVTGILNEAIDFEEDSSEYITLIDGLFTTPSSWSISLWVYAEELNNDMTIITLKDDFNVDIYWDLSDTQYKVDVYDGDNQQATFLNTQIATWIHLVGTYDGVNIRLYVNGTLVDTTAQGNPTSASVASRIASHRTGANFWDGRIDEIGLWNITLNQSQITELYNDNQSFNPYLPIAIDNSLIDLLFSNETDILNYKTLFNEGENLNVFVNWTNSTGTPFNDSIGECNITLLGGISEEESNETNFTLCDSGCDFNTINETFIFDSDNKTSEVIEDFLRIEICHVTNSNRNLEINFTCDDGSSDNQIILNTQFPLCSIGVGEIFVRTTACINNLTVNVTLNNQASNINQAHRVIEWQLDREFVAHINTFDDGDVFYNSTLGMWVTNHTHEYYKHGSKNIFANCTNSINSNLSNSTSENITIVNIPPEIFIESFTSPNGTIYELFDGIQIEYENGTWNLSVVVIDDDLDSVNVSIISSNGTILFDEFNGGNLIYNILSSVLINFDNNNFNISVVANDTNNNDSTLSLTFIMNDTIFIGINYISPDENNDTTFTTNFIDLIINLTDESLFNYELNVTNCEGNILFNFSNSNLEGNTNFLVEHTINFTGQSDGVYCSGIRVADGHTKFEIDDYVYKRNLTSRILNFNYDIDLFFNEEVAEIFVNKSLDRYRFGIKAKRKVNELEIVINSVDKIYILGKSKFKGHLVTGKYWIDFEDEDILFVRVYRLSENSVKVYIRYKDFKDSFMFNSIGEFNVNNKEVTFNVDRRPFIRFRFFTIELTLEQIFSLCLLLLIGFAIILYAEFKEHLIFMFLGGGYMLVFSILFILISPVFGVLILIASLILILKVILILLDVI